jgi:hypothetical protein
VGELEVALVASVEDRVAARVARGLKKRGCTPLCLDGPSAARLFTIHMCGGVAEVTPAMPMFIRQSAWWRPRQPRDADERFHLGECYSMLWSAAALSTAPVINRPGRMSWPQRLTTGGLAPHFSESPQAPPEIHSSSPEWTTTDASRAQDAETPATTSAAGANLSLWGRNTNNDTGPVDDLPKDVPLRARLLDPAASYEIVTVVGERAFSATVDPRTTEHQLLERSTELVRRAGAYFATVTWAVTGTAVQAVRLDPNPGEGHLRFAWAAVEDALCEDLVA